MTINFKDVYLNDYSVIAGPFLKDGPLKGNFDGEYNDFYDGEKTFEDCEIFLMGEISKPIILNKNGNFANVNFDAFRPVFDRLKTVLNM